jgi:hypothetical protein
MSHVSKAIVEARCGPIPIGVDAASRAPWGEGSQLFFELPAVQRGCSRAAGAR